MEKEAEGRREMKKAVVVIPVYKPALSETEKIVLEQGFRMFEGHSMALVVPAGLDTSAYRALAAGRGLEEYEFDASYFENIKSYNRLMLGTDLYSRFVDNYEYMLIYQLDAFVFRKELDQWCSKGYDYIGAPWPEEKWLLGFYRNVTRPKSIAAKIYTHYLSGIAKPHIYVGNGGFSLRKISSFLAIAREHRDVAESWNVNEDFFWGVFAPSAEKSFKVPGVNEAMHFSLEQNPEQYLAKLNGELPFGCHAWQKYGYVRWKKEIEKLGYSL
jgi:hypothetical protein